MPVRVLVLPLALTVALGCRPTVDPAVARATIDANNARWAQLTSAGHAESIAEFYHPQATIYPPNMPPIQGRDSIRAFFANINTMSTPTPILTIHADSIRTTADAALELGRWTFLWPTGADSGHHVVRWVENDGQWLMTHDIWNSDAPRPR
jgi:uncharacterized protein (TIGR02246 family)